MKISKEKSTEILNKSQKLNKVKKILKKEFVGLDEIIDEIINDMEAWYLFPDVQMRPTIINLWGMTSTGKTSLIIRIFELLELNSLLRFDTGEWVDKQDFQLTNKITNQIKRNKEQIPVFMFDEFQLGRTIDDDGGEIDRPQLRIIWDLLDSGKFSILEESWELSNIVKLYTKLSYLIKDKNVEVKNGLITKNKDQWELLFLEDLDKDFEDETINKHYSLNAIIPTTYIYYINTVSDEYLSEIQIAKHILTLNSYEILYFLEKIIENGLKPVEYDFSKSLIFIVGNLDSAYYNYDNMSADTSPDSLYEETKNINVSDIKNALKDLYRSEQISRLGNNHIIYKSFNKKMYYNIISLELNKIKTKIENKFKVNINFDKSINEIIYLEGVFPTQGVRPLFSTITSLVESYFGKIIVETLKNNLTPNNIDWKYENEKYIIKIDKKYDITLPINLKVDKHRQSTFDDEQTLIALHEAGHIVASIYGMNICPNFAVSRTADDGGFTQIDFPDWETKDFLLKYIISLSGGYISEKLIFGEENLTSGSFSDIERITKTALKIVKEYGMIDAPLQYSTPDFRISDSSICLNDDNLDKNAINIVEEQIKITEKILIKNKKLLLKLAEYLSKKSNINEKTIKKFVKKYGVDKVKYKTKDNFYNFKEILDKELKNLKIKKFEN